MKPHLEYSDRRFDNCHHYWCQTFVRIKGGLAISAKKRIIVAIAGLVVAVSGTSNVTAGLFDAILPKMPITARITNIGMGPSLVITNNGNTPLKNIHVRVVDTDPKKNSEVFGIPLENRKGSLDFNTGTIEPGGSYKTGFLMRFGWFLADENEITLSAKGYADYVLHGVCGPISL